MHIIFLTVAIFFAGFSAADDGLGKKRRLILSWDELTELGQPQRVQYIRDLTELIVTMEKAQAVYETADNSALEELKEFVALFRENNALLPRASADTIVFPKVPTLDATNFVGTGVRYKCLAPGLTFDQRAGTCIYLNLAEGTPSPDFKASSCPDQAVEIKGYDRIGKLCIPQESWKLLHPNRQNDLKNGIFLKAEAFLNLSEDRGATLTGIDRVLKRVAPSASAPPDLCGTDKLACNDLTPDEKKNRIAQFRQDKTDNICIYGGNFSKYRESNPDSKRWKRAGTCEPIDYFPNKETGTRCGKGMVICNPILFCVHTPEQKPGDVKKFCVPTRSDATERCKAQFESVLTKVSGSRVCDVKQDILSNFQGKWNKMAEAIEEKYNTFCLKDLNFQALFCSECKRIGEQLLAMNIKARPADCAESNVEKPKPAKPSPSDPPAQ